MTLVLFALAALAAVGDWIAVWRRLYLVEFALKPLTLALLLAAAAVADLGAAKPWVLIALALGLAGDIALLFGPARPADSVGAHEKSGAPPDRPLLAGLGAFLLGHLGYVGAFAVAGLHPLDVLAGALVAVGVGGLVLPAVLPSVRRTGGLPFAVAVAGYALVLAAATALAAGTGSVLTAIGGALFLGSDATLARDRFVARVPYGPLLVIVSYHAAQALILLGLIRSF